MKYRVHFTINKVEDSVDFEGETIEDIRDKTCEWFTDRGVTLDEASPWTEEVTNNGR